MRLNQLNTLVVIEYTTVIHLKQPAFFKVLVVGTAISYTVNDPTKRPYEEIKHPRDLSLPAYPERKVINELRKVE